jgi:hypothetical protein
LEIENKEKKKKTEISAASSTEILNNALKIVGEKLGQPLKKSSVTIKEITATTQLVQDSRQTLEALDCKIDRGKSELSS